MLYSYDRICNMCRCKTRFDRGSINFHLLVGGGSVEKDMSEIRVVEGGRWKVEDMGLAPPRNTANINIEYRISSHTGLSESRSIKIVCGGEKNALLGEGNV
ncbi:uncharacterized protein YALI1_F23560g [Yarrowia lipolytica]|uniref:Uncharacterized protein n=1 Tax=Yarrowia lipolytica TaxID=4952 RepID=A0A1D8NNW2_YARLL|nr:hypothetical protein YALI1_F23560g [Yarrowia lipolytica]